MFPSYEYELCTYCYHTAVYAYGRGCVHLRAVEIAQLARQLGRNYAVGANQTVGQPARGTKEKAHMPH